MYIEEVLPVKTKFTSGWRSFSSWTKDKFSKAKTITVDTGALIHPLHRIREGRSWEAGWRLDTRLLCFR